MRPSVRVVTSLAVLLLMLGLPVAPVVCDLMCPQAAVVSEGMPRTARLTSTTGQPPCHEAPQVAVSDTAVAPMAMSATPLPVESPVLATVPSHGCDHPTVVASRASVEGLRLPAPLVAVHDVTAHLAPGHASHARAVHLAVSGPPSVRPSGAFSPVLRI